MSISLLGSMLPALETPERRSIDEKTEILPLSERSIDSRQQRISQNMQLVRFLLEIAKEAQIAVLECRYKDLDCLVKNFGCQITALQIKRIIDLPNIIQTVTLVKGLIEEKIELCQRLRNVGGHLEVKGGSCDLVSLMKETGLDFEVAPEIAELARFRLLTIVNDNKDKGGKEIPFTNMALLTKKIKALRLNKLDALPSLFISGLQAEESKNAVLFIRQEAQLLTDEITSRAELIQRLLQSTFERKTKASNKYSSIVSLPLLYNHEAVFRIVSGVVLLKQKVTFCGKANGRLPLKLFLNLPEERVMDANELSLLSKATPILVVEGYIKALDLAEAIAKLGLFTILNSNCVAHNQYAEGTDQSPLQDEEACQDIAHFISKKDEIMEEIFEIDHVYCASLQEEER